MSLLFSPLSFSGLNLKNRVVMPPMATAIEGPGGSQEDNGLPGQATVAHYAERAKNGVGTIIVEHTYVSQRGKAHRGQLGLDRDDAIESFRRLAYAIKSNGSIAVIQINHVGALGNPEIIMGEPLGPSDVPVPKSDRRPRAMTKQEIASVISLFASCAARAKAAGFDAVEIHSAHGYLLTQFLSPITNKRTDEYGGSLENRARLLLEIVKEVKKKVGDEFPIFVRLGCIDGIEGGITYEDAVQVARMLEQAGVSMIDVSGGFMGSRPKNAPPGYFVPAARAIKKNVNVPVMVTGGITDPVFAERILRDGNADLIGIGRALLKDPKWVLKARKVLRMK